MKGPLLSEMPAWVQRVFDKLLLLALLAVLVLSMRACVRNVADAIGLQSMSSEEHAARERSALSSD
jgi:hypothetical protein